MRFAAARRVFCVPFRARRAPPLRTTRRTVGRGGRARSASVARCERARDRPPPPKVECAERDSVLILHLANASESEPLAWARRRRRSGARSVAGRRWGRFARRGPKLRAIRKAAHVVGAIVRFRCTCARKRAALGAPVRVAAAWRRAQTASASLSSAVRCLASARESPREARAR